MNHRFVKKLVIGIALLAILATCGKIVYQAFYAPRPFYLEIPMCSEHGDVVPVVVDTTWCHKVGKPWLLQGDIHIGNTTFSYLWWSLPGGWEDSAVGGRYYIPEFLRPEISDKQLVWNDYISSFRILDFGDVTYYLINRYCSPDGEFTSENNIWYLGPASSKEEYDMIYERWCQEINK